MTQEALKLALEYLESRGLAWNVQIALREALREHAMREVQRLGQEIEQEPVAWMFQHDETGRMNYVSNDGIHNPTMFLEMNPRYAFVCALYTTPPQRTWVGLTDEEYAELAEEFGPFPINQIEAKLKERNV